MIPKRSAKAHWHFCSGFYSIWLKSSDYLRFFYHAYRQQSGRWVRKVGSFSASSAQGLGCMLVGLPPAELQGSSGQAELWMGSAFLGLHSASCKLQALGFNSAMAVVCVKPKLIGENCWLCALPRVALQFRIKTCTELYCVSFL